MWTLCGHPSGEMGENNSGGDTATLLDSSGETVDTYSYSS